MRKVGEGFRSFVEETEQQRYPWLFAPPIQKKSSFDPDQPRDEIGRWTDAGGAISSSWDVSDKVLKKYLSGVSKGEVEETFAVPGMELKLNVREEMDSLLLESTWTLPDGTETGIGTRHITVTPDGKRHWRFTEQMFWPEFQGKGTGKVLFEREKVLAKKGGIADMEVMAEATIGRYVWAKWGFEYKTKYNPTQTFRFWARGKGIDPPSGGWPDFSSIGEVANYDPGIKFVPKEHKSFRNRDVAPDVVLTLGKAHMLDVAGSGAAGTKKSMGGGVRPWEGVLVL